MVFLELPPHGKGRAYIEKDILEFVMEKLKVTEREARLRIARFEGVRKEHFDESGPLLVARDGLKVCVARLDGKGRCIFWNQFPKSGQKIAITDALEAEPAVETAVRPIRRADARTWFFR